MSRLRTGRIGPWARVGLVLLGIAATQVLLGSTMARLEAAWSADLARLLGVEGVYRVPGTSLVRGTHDGQPYLLRITESCSALSAGVSLGGLSLLVLRGSWRRRLGAAAIGVGAVVLGNLLRVAAIVWVGNRSGRAELVSFHDSWGTGFSLVYLLLGFVVIVALRLPVARQWQGRPDRTFGL